MSWPETAEGWSETADGWPETADGWPETADVIGAAAADVDEAAGGAGRSLTAAADALGAAGGEGVSHTAADAGNTCNITYKTYAKTYQYMGETRAHGVSIHKKQSEKQEYVGGLANPVLCRPWTARCWCPYNQLWGECLPLLCTA